MGLFSKKPEDFGPEPLEYDDPEVVTNAEIDAIPDEVPEGTLTETDWTKDTDGVNVEGV